MNGLRLALLLVGIVVVLIIAVVSYDRRRLKTILGRRPKPTPGSKSPRWAEPALAAQSELDIRFKPKPPPDDDMPVLVVEPVDDELPADDPALAEYERAARMPLDLDPGIPPARRERRPDPAIDFVAQLPGDGVFLRDDVLGDYKQHEYLLDKPHHIYGRQADNGAWNELERESGDTGFNRVELSLQLVDGKGPVTESDLNRLAQLGLRLADKLGRPLKFSMTFEEAQQRAMELQRFCEEYDVLVIINVVPSEGGVFRGRMIEAAAERNGLQFGEMNIFHRANRRSRGARQLFSMANLYKPGEFDPSRFDEFTTGGLTFFMSVPSTFDPPTAFDELVECVTEMCRQLNGKMIDRDQQPLAEESLGRIRQQLQRITSDMENKGVPPGGETAMRLF